MESGTLGMGSRSWSSVPLPPATPRGTCGSMPEVVLPLGGSFDSLDGVTPRSAAGLHSSRRSIQGISPRPLSRPSSLLSLGGGRGHVISLTPNPSLQSLNNNNHNNSGVHDENSDSDSSLEEAVAKFRSECGHDSPRSEAMVSRMGLRPGCSLSIPVVVTVLILNILAFGCMILSFRVSHTDPASSLPEEGHTRVLLNQEAERRHYSEGERDDFARLHTPPKKNSTTQELEMKRQLLEKATQLGMLYRSMGEGNRSDDRDLAEVAAALVDGIYRDVGRVSTSATPGHGERATVSEA